MKTWILLPLLLLLCSVELLALPRPVITETEAEFTVPPTEHFLLPNGLRVTLVPYGNVPKTLIRFYSRAGNAQDTKAGLADIAYQVALEDGTQPGTLNSAERAARLGGELNTTVTPAYSYIEIDALSGDAPQAIELLGDVISDYSPQMDTLARVVNSFSRKIAIDKASPAGQAAEAFNKLMYGIHPYAQTFPSEEELQTITVEDAVNFTDAYWVGQNSHIYVSGMFDQDAVVDAIEHAFAFMREGELTKIRKPTLMSEGEMVFVERPGAPQSTLLLGTSVPQPQHDDFVALNVMNTILGGAFSSRITSNIREDKGYTYSPRSVVDPKPKSTLWYQTADVTAIHTADSVREILNEILRMQSEPVPEKELRGFKNYRSGLFMLRNSSRAGLVNQLWFHQLYDLPEDALRTKIEQINRVSATDVQRVANTYLKIPGMLLVVVGDAGIQPQLEEINSMLGN